MKYSYQAQKLGEARRALMLPVSESEHAAYGYASALISLGFNNFDFSALPTEFPRHHLESLQLLMDVQQARELTRDEKRQFSQDVDALAHWFDMEFWLSSRK